MIKEFGKSLGMTITILIMSIGDANRYVILQEDEYHAI